MRVAYVSPYPPSRDGIGDYTAALAEATRDAGNDVAVITPAPVDGAPPEVLGSLGDVGRLRAWRPDVIHVQFGVAAFGTRLPTLFGLLHQTADLPARVVVTAHEVTRDTALLRAPGRLLYRRLAGHADLVLVHTADARDAILRGAAQHQTVVEVPHHRRPPPAPTCDAAALRARHGIEGAPVLLAFGFIHVDKGLQDLIEALALLPRGTADLVVAGDVRRRTGAFRGFELADRLHLARVRRRVATLGLSPHVHWTGYVPAGEIAPWFDAADAAVLPYRRIEQSGVGSLAAALGVPVLASTAGRLSEDYGDPRWTFPPARPDLLAGAITTFLAAPREVRGDADAPRAATGTDIAAIAGTTIEAYRHARSRPTRGRAAVRLA